MAQEDRLKIIAAFISIPAAILATIGIYQFWRSGPTEQPKVSTIVNLPPPTPDFGIKSGDLRVWKEKEYALWFIPIRTVPWYALDVVVINTAEKQLDGCYLRYEYKYADGRNGGGAAYQGLWSDYFFEKKAVNWTFALPPQKNYRGQYFFEGMADKPEWLRLQLTCEKPRLEVSPSYDVDLQHAIGW